MKIPSQWLEGNGAALVREKTLAEAVQRALERMYELDRVPDVGAFVARAGRGEREALLVRQAEDGVLEMSLRIPRLSRLGLDALCQVIEGVSHFVYLADRARVHREATQLELELQAEVDKYAVLSASMAGFDRAASVALRERLYELVSFAHPEETAVGERYRVANRLADRFTRRLERDYVAPRRYDGLRAELCRFYRMGQEEKLRVGALG